MKPIVHGLEARYSDRIGFVYLNVEDPNTDALKQDLGFRYMPYFVLLDGDGNILQQWAGLVTEADFVAAFESALNYSTPSISAKWVILKWGMTVDVVFEPLE